MNKKRMKVSQFFFGMIFISTLKMYQLRNLKVNKVSNFRKPHALHMPTYIQIKKHIITKVDHFG